MPAHKLFITYQYCVGLYCPQCDEDFESLDLDWRYGRRWGHWPTKAIDGGSDHHVENCDRFQFDVQLKYLAEILQISVEIELLERRVNLYSPGTLILKKPDSSLFERELPNSPHRGPEPQHAELLKEMLAFLGFDAEIKLLPVRDCSRAEDDKSDL